MARRSAGVLLYRRTESGMEVLLAHPGGPLWARRDAGAWSIPKGEYGEGEDPRAAALREFAEETGVCLSPENALDLGESRQKGGKVVRAFAIEGDLDPAALVSNRIEIEWPPRSGRRLTVPEIDRAAWLAPALAREKLIEAQRAFVDRLEAALGEGAR